MSQANGTKETAFDFDTFLKMWYRLQKQHFFGKICVSMQNGKIVHIEQQAALKPGDPLP